MKHTEPKCSEKNRFVQRKKSLHVGKLERMYAKGNMIVFKSKIKTSW